MLKNFIITSVAALLFGLVSGAAAAEDDAVPEGDGYLAKVLKDMNHPFCLDASGFYSQGSVTLLTSNGGDDDPRGYQICQDGQWKICVPTVKDKWVTKCTPPS